MEEHIKKTLKKVSKNIIIAVFIAIYYFIANILYIKIEEKTFFFIFKFLSLAILLVSIIVFEIAYHKDSGKIAINGIEILILAINNLLVLNIINKENISFEKYIIGSSIAFFIYYILKGIIIYTNEKRKYADSLSDISEIVKISPIKKEAKKKNKLRNV